MRTRALLGMAALLAALPVAAAVAADGPGGGMRGAPMASPAAMRGGVPSYGLRAPQGAPGGWSQGGWHSGGPGVGGPRPGGPRPGGPNGGWHGGNPQGGGWHGGGWSGGHGNWGGRGNWGGGYHRPFRGWRMPSFWLSPTYFIPDYGYYGLPAPGYGQNWVRYYDDAVLVGGDGLVADSVSGLDWDRYDRGPVPDYAGPGSGYDDRDYGPGPDDQVTWGGRYGPGTTVYHAAPGTTTIVIQTQPVVTTTTRTVVEERTVYVKRPVRKWRPRRVCTCYK